VLTVAPLAKALRADLIAGYVRQAGLPGVVCFSCGNASAALRRVGLYVVDVSPSGDVEARRWWQPAEIARAWPHLFDATSGHLPLPLMAQLAAALRAAMGPLEPGPHDVPTGSGETILCLRWAYPGVAFRAVYGGTRATRYEAQAPLVQLVAAGGDVVHLGA